jgi:hypothetical protein
MPKLNDMLISTEYSKQRGASALEASFAAVPILLVCLLGIELVHAHQVKQLASLALHEAGRVASVTGADHKQVNQAFARALAPRLVPSGQAAHASERQDATHARYRQRYALPLWQLEIADVHELSAPPNTFRAVQLNLIYVHEPLQAWLRQVLKQSTRWLSASPIGLIARAQRQGLVAMRLSRRAMIHSNGVHQRPKSSLEDALQQPPKPAIREDLGTIPFSQRIAPRAKIHQTETQTQASPSKSKAQLDSIAKSADATKSLSLVPLKPEQEDLCGVLLCCAQ